MGYAADLLVKLGFKADSRPLAAIEQRLDSINGRLNALVGAEAVRGLLALTRQLGGSALALENEAVAAGVGAESLQALEFAAVRASGSSAALGGVLGQLSKLMYGAKMGAQDAQETFYQLGISFARVQSFRTTEDALYAVMDALRSIKDPIRQAVLMDRALGGGARSMARFVLAGSAAAKAGKQAAFGISAVTSAASLRQSAIAEGRLKELELTFRAISTDVAARFAPALTTAVDKLQTFYARHKEQIGELVDVVIYRLSYAVGFVSALMETVGAAFVDFLARHKDQVLKWIAVLVGLRVAIGVINGLAAAISAIKTVIAAVSAVVALAATPWAMWAVAVVTVAAALALAHYAWQEWKGIPSEKTTEGKLLIWLNDVANNALHATAAMGKLSAAFVGDAGETAFGIDKQKHFGVLSQFDPKYLENKPLLKGMRASTADVPLFLRRTVLGEEHVPLALRALPPANQYDQSQKTFNMVANITVPPGTGPQQATSIVADGLKKAVNSCEMTTLALRYNTPLF